MDPTTNTTHHCSSNNNNNNHHRIRLCKPHTSSPQSWCCSLKFKNKIKNTKPPPEIPDSSTHFTSELKTPILPKPISKTPFSIVGRIPNRRILSPGRVSPIDSLPDIAPAAVSVPAMSPPVAEESGGGDGFDVRLKLKGKKGGRLGLELNSRVLRENSDVFGELIEDFKRRNDGGGCCLCRIEVPEVKNLAVFRLTIELMFEEDIVRRLVEFGVYRAIDVLEVSASIKFRKGVSSCLKYLEAVPWNEHEEEKIRKLFTRLRFDETSAQEILCRLHLPDSVRSQQHLPSRLLWSITSCENTRARNELKSLVKGLLCRPSVCEKDNLDIKEDLYSVSRCCISSLITLFEDSTSPGSPTRNKGSGRPSAETISWQVDNITWLLEILLEHQMAEEFVDMWADQKELIRMHGIASPLIRYELSRISALLFTAMGTRRIHCGTRSRSGVFHSWFGPFLLDFGWIQRCRKGIDVRQLEEAMGQALLTLPLEEQYGLFMEWFTCFSRNGTECPNLSNAFQVWWRRAFLRDSRNSCYRFPLSE
ncbi:BTB/POZ domain-containing protein [Drosera capensis]